MLLLITTQARGVATGPEVGLPEHQKPGDWLGVAQTGMTETARAKQWVRVPVHVAAVWNLTAGKYDDLPPDVDVRWIFSNEAYFVSPTGAREQYGHMPPFRVRTVAFGSIPVEATVQISQSRGADGLPIPIKIVSEQDIIRAVDNYLYDTVVEDQVQVGITSLKVDDISLELGGGCRTAEPARLSLVGKGSGKVMPSGELQNLPLTEHFKVALGGRLSGTVNIPAFVGCRTVSGEDVSRLLTATVSGPGNGVEFQVSGPYCENANDGMLAPPPVGATTPEAAGCAPDVVPEDVPYP